MNEKLKQIIIDRAIRLAPDDLPFRLASGQTTNYYANMRAVLLLNGSTTHLIGQALANILPNTIKAIGGVPTAGLLMMAPLMAERVDLTGFYIRAEPKSHGLNQQIEGYINPLNNALLEDTVTTGQSILRCAIVARDAGYRVEHALTLLDREQGGSELLAQHGIELRSVFKISDLGII